MGCGVSKQEVTEPSRIQTVVVNVGSPESHLKAHEAALKQNHGLVCLVGTQCNGPSCGVNNSDLNSSVLHVSTLILSDGLQHLVESPQTKEDVQKEDVQNEQDYECLPQQTTTKDLPGDETPQLQQVVQDSPLFRSTNGLVGTLAGLDEILGIQEASSLKLAIKVTAEKIMNCGGVLHSLEDQVGGFSYHSVCKGDTLIELEPQAQEGPEVLELAIENREDGPIALTRSPKPSLEGFRKRLPPILTPPNSAVIDKTSTSDPFAKTPFPTHCQPRVEEIQDLTNKAQPPSPQLPHTTEMVAFENIKEIMVMDGASCGSGKRQNPPSIILLEDMHCEVDKIILVETMEAQRTANGNYGSNIMHQNCHNIIVGNLIQEFGENSGVNTISPLTPFSTCSRRIEYLEEDDIKPLSSDEFYS
ncbi:unnamed protein product [Calypogeia fissa]